MGQQFKLERCPMSKIKNGTSRVMLTRSMADVVKGLRKFYQRRELGVTRTGMRVMAGHALFQTLQDMTCCQFPSFTAVEASIPSTG